MRDELRRMALIGSGIAELTRHRAEQTVKDLVRSGDVRREQASSLVKDLMERSRDTRRELAAFVREEIRAQIQGLGLASGRDVERLERRVGRLEDLLKEMERNAAPAKKTTAKKTTAKKTTARKTTARKTTARKTTAKKTTAKKTTASRTIAPAAGEGREGGV